MKKVVEVRYVEVIQLPYLRLVRYFIHVIKIVWCGTDKYIIASGSKEYVVLNHLPETVIAKLDVDTECCINIQRDLRRRKR